MLGGCEYGGPYSFQNKFRRCRRNIAIAPSLAEIQPSFVVVVATTPQLDQVDARLAAQCPRIDVVELTRRDKPAGCNG